MPEIYRNLGIRAIRLPVGRPEWQPCELFFNWLKSDLEHKSGPTGAYHRLDYATLEREVQESAGRVTLDMVKGWYRHAWGLLHPHRAYPAAIRP